MVSVGVSGMSCVGCYGKYFLRVGVLQCVIARLLDGCIEI